MIIRSLNVEPPYKKKNYILFTIENYYLFFFSLKAMFNLSCEIQSDNHSFEIAHGAQAIERLRTSLGGGGASRRARGGSSL